MIIDFHTHCFPHKIADRAVSKLSHASGGLKPHTDGTVDGLRERMKRDQVDLSVVLSIATNGDQQESVNNFAQEVRFGVSSCGKCSFRAGKNQGVGD